MNDNNDIKFRKLFQKTGLESPSEEFTSKLMKKIEQMQPGTEEAPDKNTLNSWFWGIFITVLVGFGFGSMYFFDIGILPESFKIILSPAFESIFSSFLNIFETVKISSTTLVIILGFFFLVGIERILNKLKVTKNIYFSF